jgi:hypothetical protein
MLKVSAFVLVCLSALYVSAQPEKSSSPAPMPQTSHDMTQMDSTMHASRSSMRMQPHSLIEFVQQHSASGTDAEPNSTPIPMLMTMRHGWMLMFHGEGFLSDIQQSGPRGTDKLFSTNWLMPMAQRPLGRGTLTLRTMLSLEPATVTDRRYPELFQEGETAYGLPLVDGQHPHNFFMEVAAFYDYKLTEASLLTIYAAPVGDPALGPPAYPHRVSTAEDPLAPLGHHLQDSTHISDDVITVGLTYHNVRVEASGFHGREPGEDRWHIDQGKIDSWATRLTFNPGQNWSLQYSIGQLHAPEALFPTEDIRRMTASLMYNRPLKTGNWASMLLWGRNQSLADGNVGNSYLLESTLRFLRKNYAWTRIENVDRTNELLIGEHPLPPGFVERYFARVQAYTAGYDHDLGHIPHLSTALGGQITAYGVPDELRPLYGVHPVSVMVSLRVRPF